MLNEVVVLQGPIDIFRFPLISTRGEFTLSEQNFEFNKSALEDLLLSALNIEIQLNIIKSIKMIWSIRNTDYYRRTNVYSRSD